MIRTWLSRSPDFDYSPAGIQIWSRLSAGAGPSGRDGGGGRGGQVDIEMKTIQREAAGTGRKEHGHHRGVSSLKADYLSARCQARIALT